MADSAVGSRARTGRHCGSEVQYLAALSRGSTARPGDRRLRFCAAQLVHIPPSTTHQLPPTAPTGIVILYEKYRSEKWEGRLFYLFLPSVILKLQLGSLHESNHSSSDIYFSTFGRYNLFGYRLGFAGR